MIGEKVLLEILGIVMPVQCPGCGVWDEILCPRCAALASGVPLLSDFALTADTSDEELEAYKGGRYDLAYSQCQELCGNVPIVRLGDYEDPLRAILVSAKHSRAFRGQDFLREGGRSLGRCLAQALLGSSNRGDEAAAHVQNRGKEEWWVVPAPSSWKRRLKSTSPTTPLAHGVAHGFSEFMGAKVRVVDAARMKVGTPSQAGLSGAGRRRARAGSMRSLLVPPDPSRVVLVDDVSTTGATLRELARVLGGCAGICVAAAVTSPSSYDAAHAVR